MSNRQSGQYNRKASLWFNDNTNDERDELTGESIFNPTLITDLFVKIEILSGFTYVSSQGYYEGANANVYVRYSPDRVITNKMWFIIDNIRYSIGFVILENNEYKCICRSGEEQECLPTS